EGGQIQIEHGGLGKGLDIPHPTKAFVTLRTIVGRTHQVGALGPKDIAHELIERGIGAFEFTHLAGPPMKDKPESRSGPWRLSQAGDLYKAKTVIGKTRLEREFTIGRRSVTVLLGCAA